MDMRKDEAAFHAKAMRWLKYNLDMFPKSFKIETKVARLGESRFNFKELSEKEERLLLQAKHKSCIQTNSDLGGMGTYCDADVVSGGGFIFIQWIRPRNKKFYVIDIDVFIRFREQHNMKSMLECDANRIALLICELK